jgi:uncharacterized protein YkwD
MRQYFFAILLVLLLAGEARAQGIEPCSPDYAGMVVQLTNAYRQTYGRAPLKWNAELAQAAANHAYWMASANTLSHIDARGMRVRDRVEQTHYAEFMPTVAENIANGHNTPQKVIAAWQASPSHNMALLLPDADDIGVACFVNPASQYKTFWVQVFASREGALIFR